MAHWHVLLSILLPCSLILYGVFSQSRREATVVRSEVDQHIKHRRRSESMQRLTGLEVGFEPAQPKKAAGWGTKGHIDRKRSVQSSLAVLEGASRVMDEASAENKRGGTSDLLSYTKELFKETLDAEEPDMWAAAHNLPALWQLLHRKSVHLATGGSGSTAEAMAFVYCSVQAALECQVCRGHFLDAFELGLHGAGTVLQPYTNEEKHRNLVIWLWKVHNVVSIFRALDKTDNLDWRWPTVDACPGCWLDADGPPTEELSEIKKSTMTEPIERRPWPWNKDHTCQKMLTPLLTQIPRTGFGVHSPFVPPTPRGTIDEKRRKAVEVAGEDLSLAAGGPLETKLAELETQLAALDADDKETETSLKLKKTALVTWKAIEQEAAAAQKGEELIFGKPGDWKYNEAKVYECVKKFYSEEASFEMWGPKQSPPTMPDWKMSIEPDGKSKVNMSTKLAWRD